MTKVEIKGSYIWLFGIHLVIHRLTRSLIQPLFSTTKLTLD